MDEIRLWLYIGKYRDMIDGAYLRAMSIDAMLELADDVKQPGIISLYLPVEDVAPIPFELIHSGGAFVREHKALGQRILIACGAGINRSSAFCTAVLKEEEGLDLLAAFKEVKRLHNESEPHQPVWQSLCEYYGENIPYQDISLL